MYTRSPDSWQHIPYIFKALMMERTEEKQQCPKGITIDARNDEDTE